MDKLSAEQRHRNMAAIRSKDTKPEMIVRRGLWKRGFRYRLNHKRLPGHPDLVLRKYRTCIFVNGCFWHGHHVKMDDGRGMMEEGRCEMEEGRCEMEEGRCETEEGRGMMENGSCERTEMVGSECCKIPKTNRDFWVAKIRRNKERDREEQRQLAAMGWHCITVWECELKAAKREETLDALAFTLNHIWLQDHGAKVTPYDKQEEETTMPMAAEEEV